MRSIVEDGFDRDRSEYVSRRFRRPNAQQKRDFLDLIAQGMPRDGAARLVGSTASRMRSEARRDTQFAAWCAEAEANGQESRPDTIRGALHEVALGHLLGDREEHPKAFEALKMLAETWLPEMEHKRAKQVNHGQTAPFEILVGQRIPEELLAALTAEERAGLLETVRLLEAGQQRMRVIEGGKQ